MQPQKDVIRHHPEVTDGFLAQEALNGNEQAFEMLVHRYSASLFSFICHIMKDYDRACDILQQVFLQLYRSLATLRVDEPLKPWLFQVARNRCLDDIRQRNRRQVVLFSDLEIASEGDDQVVLFTLPDNSPIPEELAERHDLQQHLLQAIDALPPRFRSVVFLRYTAQMSFSEIAKVLSMPTATAKTYFQRAKPHLRASLSEVAAQWIAHP